MDMEKALLDPASVFEAPADICDDPALSTDEKVRILRRWEYDARELQVADEENMAGDRTDLLDQVLAALARLKQSGGSDGAPTKQGGD